MFQIYNDKEYAQTICKNISDYESKIIIQENVPTSLYKDVFKILNEVLENIRNTHVIQSNDSNISHDQSRVNMIQAALSDKSTVLSPLYNNYFDRLKNISEIITVSVT